MKKVISVLVETTLEPGNLQVVLDENITFRTPFVTGIAVPAPINSETSVATKPQASDTREPQQTRDKTSRPSLSVPQIEGMQ